MCTKSSFQLIVCKELFYKSDISKENYQKAFKKLTSFFFRTSCHPYVTRMSFVCHVIRMSLVCTCMSPVSHSYILVCHPYVTHVYLYVIPMYTCVIRMSLVCTRMSSVCLSCVLVCHSYLLVCHPYVTRVYSYVIRMPLVCGFTMNHF